MKKECLLLWLCAVCVYGDTFPIHNNHKEAKPYSFSYNINDPYDGPDFGQKETYDGNKVTGSYSLQLPDGRRQTVSYIADHENGFVADVSYDGEAKYAPHSEPFIVQSSHKPSYQHHLREKPQPHLDPRNQHKVPQQPHAQPVEHSQTKHLPEPPHHQQFSEEPLPQFQPQSNQKPLHPDPHQQPQFLPDPNQQPHFLPDPHQQPQFLPDPNQQPHFLPDPHQQPQFLPDPNQQPHFLPDPHQQPQFLPDPNQQPHFLPEPHQQPQFQPETHHQQQFQPEPHQQPKFQLEPHQPQFQPDPHQQPQFQPEPHQQPQFQPEPHQQPQFQPEPHQQPQFQPEPHQQPQFQHEPPQQSQIKPNPHQEQFQSIPHRQNQFQQALHQQPPFQSSDQAPSQKTKTKFVDPEPPQFKPKPQKHKKFRPRQQFPQQFPADIANQNANFINEADQFVPSLIDANQFQSLREPDQSFIPSNGPAPPPPAVFQPQAPTPQLNQPSNFIPPSGLSSSFQPELESSNFIPPNEFASPFQPQALPPVQQAVLDAPNNLPQSARRPSEFIETDSVFPQEDLPLLETLSESAFNSAPTVQQLLQDSNGNLQPGSVRRSDTFDNKQEVNEVKIVENADEDNLEPQPKEDAL